MRRADAATFINVDLVVRQPNGVCRDGAAGEKTDAVEILDRRFAILGENVVAFFFCLGDVDDDRRIQTI